VSEIITRYNCTCGSGTRTDPDKDCFVHNATLRKTWRQKFNTCANCEILESRVRELEAELEVEKANSIADMATMNVRKSKIEALESERDNLKEEVEECQKKTWYLHPKSDHETSPYKGKGKTWIQEAHDLYQDNKQLRARHAALVEVAKKSFSQWNTGTHEQECKAMLELKAALAEVKA
jgi:hypothetical protein